MPDPIDLRPQTVRIKVARNDSWSLQVTLEAPGGTPIDLTGKTISAHLRVVPDATEYTALSVVPVDLEAGQFAVGQASATSSGYYDIQVTTGSEVRTYVRGRLDVDADVTRP